MAEITAVHAELARLIEGQFAPYRETTRCLVRAALNCPAGDACQEEVLELLRSWSQAKAGEVIDTTLTDLMECIERYDSAHLLTELELEFPVRKDSGVRPTCGDAHPPQVTQPDQPESQADESEGDEELQTTSPQARGGCGRGGMVTVRELIGFLKRHGYVQNKGGNGELVFSLAWGQLVHKVSVPNSPGRDVNPRTLTKILKRVGAQLGGTVQILRGHLVLAPQAGCDR